jgi:glucosamine-6-phosphate deaminase
MKIIDGLSYEQLSASCAHRIETEVIENLEAVVALAWGTSTLRVCAELSQEPRRVSYAKSKIVAIDEYIYRDAKGPRFIGQEFLEQNLYRNIDLPLSNRLGPTSVDRLDATLRSLGGIDLGVYGMGVNGHVAANEPGTPFESLSHAQLLDPSTVEISARKYGLDPEHLHFAHTMGLATLFSAKQVILLISGIQKFEAALDALFGPVTVDCPASLFQHHPDCTVLVDFRLPRPVAV